MPKFHDEFFRSGSSKHDELVSKIILEKEKIMGEIWLQRLFYNKFDDSDRDIYVCRANNKPEWCNLDHDIAHSGIPNCNFSFNYRCKYCDADKYKSDKMKFETTKCKSTQTDNILIIDTETEKICKSGAFIIGYIDVMYIVQIERFWSVKISDGWGWEHFGKQERDIKIVLDAKPELKDWGGPLRQIKTYMDSERADYGVIVTYSSVSDEHQEILAQENVFVITLENQIDNKKVDLTSFGG